MRLLLLLGLALLAVTAPAADLFGTGSDKQDGMPLGEQQAIYKQFFGEMEEAAGSSSSKRLKLARQLQVQYQDQRFKNIRPYMLMRMNILTKGSRKSEALALRIFAFHERHAEKKPDHAANRTLIELLTQQLKKAPRDERMAIAQEITAVWNQNAALSLKSKAYERACDDYKELEYWLKKTGDRDGAEMADNMIDVIEDHVDEREDIEELLQRAKSETIDADEHLTIARFSIKEGDWETAHHHLQQTDNNALTEIASLAQQDELDINKQGQCAVAIGKALKDDDNTDDPRLHRTLLALGVALKKQLKMHENSLSPALKIKYSLVSEEWEAQLDELGPDPLTGFKVADSGASIDEARLIRMGWVPVFDHEHPFGLRPGHANSDHVQVTVKKGIQIIKLVNKGRVLIEVHNELQKAKAVKIRFKFVSQHSYGWLTLSGPGAWNEKNSVRLAIRNENVGFTKAYGAEAGSKVLLKDEWNDATFTWNGKEVTASLNGEDYDQPLAFPFDKPHEFQIAPGGIADDLELHIQSLLYLPDTE